MRTPFDLLVTAAALHVVEEARGVPILDHMGDDLPYGVATKNVCFKTSPQLSDRVDELVGLLGVSKRRFLESCVAEAVNRAEAIMEAEGVYEVLARDAGQEAAA